MSVSTPAQSAFLALSCVGFLVSAAPAHAADGPVAADSDSDQRRDIVVEGRVVPRASSDKATRALVDTPQTITVLNEEQLKQQNLLTLQQALSTVPGITFGAGEGGGGYGDNINLRGFSASNDITVDGIRDSAQYNRTDPFNLSAIEVYNGANSVFNGSGSVGGTINLAQKRPFGRSETVIEGGVGTDDYYRATIDTNQRLNDLVAVRLNAMAHRQDVPGRDVETYKRWGVAPSVRLGFGPTALTLSYVHQEDDNIPVYGVPYYPALGGLLPGAKYSGYYGYANVDKQHITLDQVTARFEHDFSDHVTLTNLSRWQRVYQFTTVDPPQGTFCLADGMTQAGVPCAAGQVPGTFYPSGPRGTTRVSENQLLVNQTNLKLDFATAGLRHTLIVGASVSQEDYDLTQGNVLRNADGSTPALPAISIANPGTRYTGPINFIPSSIQTGHLSNVALYAFDTTAITDWLELNGAVRWERNEGDFRADTIATPAAGGGVTASLLSTSKESLFSWRAGVVAKPTKQTSLYFAYGNSKTPSQATVRLGCNTTSAGNFCDAAPEQAESYEVGAKAQLAGGKLLLSAALFRNDQTNYRVPSVDPTIPDPQVLDGRARVDGIALGASGNVTMRWAVFANYTYLKSQVLQSITNYCLANPGVGTCPTSDPQRGNPLQSTPDHSGSLFTTYEFPFGLKLGYGLTYQGKYTIRTDTPSLKADDYLTHRLFVSYAFANGLTAQVNVQNLTDERYYTNIRNNVSGWAVPGEGRAVRLSLFWGL